MKIIIEMINEQETDFFFFKEKHFKCIAEIQISLWCAVFARLQLHTYI